MNTSTFKWVQNFVPFFKIDVLIIHFCYLLLREKIEEGGGGGVSFVPYLQSYAQFLQFCFKFLKKILFQIHLFSSFPVRLE